LTAIAVTLENTVMLSSNGHTPTSKSPGVYDREM